MTTTAAAKRHDNDERTKAPALHRVTAFITPSQNAFLEEAAGALEVGASEVLRRILQNVMRSEEQKKMLFELAPRRAPAARSRRSLASARA